MEEIRNEVRRLGRFGYRVVRRYLIDLACHHVITWTQYGEIMREILIRE